MATQKTHRIPWLFWELAGESAVPLLGSIRVGEFSPFFLLPGLWMSRLELSISPRPGGGNRSRGREDRGAACLKLPSADTALDAHLCPSFMWETNLV